MSQIKKFAKQLEQEVTATREMLKRVPNDKLDWQPHPKSMTMRRLAAHVAELPGWVGMALDTSELDFANNQYEPQVINNNAELLEYFEKNLEDARQHFASAREEQLDDTWTLRNGDQIYSTDSKEDVIRMSISQIIHHRAQLGVYLRLLDVPIPGSYGPSADEMNF